MTDVFFDNKFIGTVDDGNKFVDSLRISRQEGKINSYFNSIDIPKKTGLRIKFLKALQNYDTSKYPPENPVIVFKKYFTWWPQKFPWFMPDWKGPFAGLDEGSYNYNDIKEINGNVDATASFIVKD